MENKSTTIIDVQVEATSAIKAIAEYQTKLEETKQAEIELKDAIKMRGSASKEDRQRRMSDTTERLRPLERDSKPKKT